MRLLKYWDVSSSTLWQITQYISEIIFERVLVIMIMLMHNNWLGSFVGFDGRRALTGSCIEGYNKSLNQLGTHQTIPWHIKTDHQCSEGWLNRVPAKRHSMIYIASLQSAGQGNS